MAPPAPPSSGRPVRRRLAAAAVGAAAALAGATHPAHAQGLVVVVDAGVVAPAAPPEFSDFWNAGWTAGGGLAVVLSPLWEIATSAHYQRFPADEAHQIDGLLLSGPGGVSEIASIDGRDARTLSLTTEVRFQLRATDAAIRPYLSFGAGFFQVSTFDATVVAVSPGIPSVSIPGDTDSALAATVGAGARTRLAPGVLAVLECLYTIGFTEQSSTEYLPLRAGLAFEI